MIRYCIVAGLKGSQRLHRSRRSQLSEKVMARHACCRLDGLMRHQFSSLSAQQTSLPRTYEDHETVERGLSTKNTAASRSYGSVMWLLVSQTGLEAEL